MQQLLQLLQKAFTTLIQLADQHTEDPDEIQLTGPFRSLVNILKKHIDTTIEQQGGITTIIGLREIIKKEINTDRLKLFELFGLNRDLTNPQKIINSIVIPNLKTAQLLKIFLDNFSQLISSHDSSDDEKIGRITAALISKFMQNVSKDDTYTDLFRRIIKSWADQLTIKIDQEIDRIEKIKLMQSTATCINAIKQEIENIRNLLESGDNIDSITPKLNLLISMVTTAIQQLIPQLHEDNGALKQQQEKLNQALTELSSFTLPIDETFIKKIENLNRELDLGLDSEYLKKLRQSLPKGIIAKTGSLLYNWTVGWIIPSNQPPSPIELIAQATKTIAEKTKQIESMLQKNTAIQTTLKELSEQTTKLKQNYDVKKTLAILQQKLDILRSKLDSYNQSYLLVKFLSKLFKTKSYKASLSQHDIETAIKTHREITQTLSASINPQIDTEEQEHPSKTLDQTTEKTKKLKQDIEALNNSVGLNI